MAFDLDNFAPVSAQANSNAPRVWTYETSDPIALLNSGSYFPANFQLQDNDLIYAVCSDGVLLGELDKATGRVIDVRKNIGGLHIITDISDFLNDDGLTITLDAGQYLIANDIDLLNREVVFNGNVAFVGLGSSSTTVSFSSSTLITASKAFAIRNLTFSGGGVVLDAVGDGVGVAQIDRCRFAGGGIGRVKNYTAALITNIISVNSSIPLLLDGPFTRVIINQFASQSATSAKCIVFAPETNVSDTAAIESCFFDGASPLAIEVQSGAVFPNEGFQVINTTFENGVTPVVGLSQQNDETFFKSNIGLDDTLANFRWTISGNALPTVITAINTPVVINAATTVSSSQRFINVSNPNRATYTGAKSRGFQVSGSFVLSTTQSNQRIGVVVLKNGQQTSIAFSASTTGSAASRIENLSISGPLVLAESDYVELALFNITSTDDITCTDAAISIIAIN